MVLLFLATLNGLQVGGMPRQSHVRLALAPVPFDAYTEYMECGLDCN